MRFLVVVIEPAGYQHTGTIAEVAETLVCGLRALGHPARLTVNGFLPDALNIVLAAHFLSPALIATLPANTVIYNLEQVEDSLFEWAPGLRDLFARFEVWDYSKRNIEALRARGFINVRHLPIGYVPELTRVARADAQDIDVLFYGAVNERRRIVLRGLTEAGLKLKAVFGAYGAARDELIARAKVVLNLHKHEAQVFEIVRVSYLLANRKAVVSEVSPHTEIEPDLIDAVAGAPYEKLVETCQSLVADDLARGGLEQRGYERMTARDETLFLGDLLSRRMVARPRPRPGRRG
jgi:hypothetical protein